MKKQITKGKVIQRCMKVVAAVVVAGGVGFQFQEIQELNKDLAILNQEYKVTVQTLETVKSDNLNLQDEYASLSVGAEKLTTEVTELKQDNQSLEKKKAALAKEKAALQKDKKSLQQDKKALQAKNGELAEDLQEERDRPRILKTSTAPKAAKTSTAAVQATSKPTVQKKAAPATAKPSVQAASMKKEPVAKAAVAKAPAPTPQSVSQVVNGSATAYNANCEGCSGITASGKKVGPGMVAMASWVPLGTKVRITCPSYPSINGVYTVEDRGGAIKGNKVDIFVHTYDQAIDFGRRDITIEILN